MVEYCEICGCKLETEEEKAVGVCTNCSLNVVSDELSDDSNNHKIIL